jgi:plastocyanin
MKHTLKASTASLLLLACTVRADAPAEHPVNQKDKEFSVTEITIKPGEQVLFKNDDSVTHNVFSNSKANAFTIKIQKPGETSTVEFKDEGVTEVRCAIHPKMKLVVTVKN